MDAFVCDLEHQREHRESVSTSRISDNDIYLTP
jgi:hypothetical protein